MSVEPVGDGRHVFQKVGPAVASPLLDHELGLDAGGFQLVEDQLGLLDRDQMIGVAVDDQRGRIVGRSVISRADLPSGLDDLVDVSHRHKVVSRGVQLVKVEGGLEPGERPAAQGDLTGLAIVEEIGGRKETGDRLNPARHLVQPGPQPSDCPCRRLCPASARGARRPSRP